MPYHSFPGPEVSVGVPPPPSVLNLGDGWRSFQFHIHDFASVDSTKDHYFESPTFICNGHKWQLVVYPGGDNVANEGYLSMYLRTLSRDSGAAAGIIITTNCQFDIIDKLGKKTESKKASSVFSAFNYHSGGWHDFIRRSDILNNGVIGSDGALTIVVSIEGEQSAIFVPPNSAAKKMDAMFFNDEATADAWFEVVSTNIGQSVSFHAHRFILSKFAPMLAELVATSDTFTITDVKPDVFRHLLYYIYGGEVPSKELKMHARDIIDAADKYDIVNLKLTAEAAYVESTDITIDNAIDNLLYADGKNCALLKEKVMNFLADHPNEAKKLSFEDCPGYIMKDLLVAVGRKDKNKNESSGDDDELSTLDVSALRRKLHEKGLNVDGSREAMIESLKNSTDGYFRRAIRALTAQTIA